MITFTRKPHLLERPCFRVGQLDIEFIRLQCFQFLDELLAFRRLKLKQNNTYTIFMPVALRDVENELNTKRNMKKTEIIA